MWRIACSLLDPGRSFDGMLRYFHNTKQLVQQRGQLPMSRQEARAREQQLRKAAREERQQQRQKARHEQQAEPQAAAAMGGALCASGKQPGG
jgi:G:T/U-mismatch repair DNA glycosylase